MASAVSAGVVLAFLVLVAVSPLATGRALHESEKRPIQTERPYNIAHRGANGELPEESAPAYQRAIEVGADFIETDILATKDGKLFCMHDVTLEATTDVANHTRFADRIRTYEVQGANVTGRFSVDFTWAELQTLKLNQRFDFRDQSYNGKFKIISFEEYIEIALKADRVVGIYPECKNPVFINQHVKWAGGKTVENIFVETLLKYGYKGKYLSKDWKKKPLFIQSFAPTALVKISKFINSPLIFLIDDTVTPTQDTNQSYYQITTGKYFEYLRSFGVVGIGPWKDTIAVPNANNYATAPNHLVKRAHEHGLAVHPYTFRNENEFLHFNFHQDPYQEYAYWIHTVGIDGLFTDFTRSLALYQDWTSPLKDDK